MSKKQLKQRIKELEAENIMLRAMAFHPVYIYLYTPLPYNPYWQPYQPYRYLPTPGWEVVPSITYPIGPVTCEPEWLVRPSPLTNIGDSSKYEIGVNWGKGDEMTVTATGTYKVVN